MISSVDEFEKYVNKKELMGSFQKNFSPKDKIYTGVSK